MHTNRESHWCPPEPGYLLFEPTRGAQGLAVTMDSAFGSRGKDDFRFREAHLTMLHQAVLSSERH